MTYKLEFELVNPIGKGNRFYSGEKPNTKPSEIPDEYWLKTSNETDNPWQQYNQLVEWETEGIHLIRNVVLYEQVSEPRWKIVEKKETVKEDNSTLIELLKKDYYVNKAPQREFEFVADLHRKVQR